MESNWLEVVVKGNNFLALSSDFVFACVDLSRLTKGVKLDLPYIIV